MISPRFTLLTISQWLTVALPLLMLAGPAPIDIGAGLVTILFLVHTVIARDTAWLRMRWLQVAFLIWIYMCLRSLFLEDMAAAFGRSFTYLRFPLFAAALACWVLPDKKIQAWLWRSLAVAIGFLILDSFWQYAFLTDITGREAQRLYNDVIRLTGPFSNPRVGVTIVWLFFPVLLPLLADGRTPRRILAIGWMVGGAAAVYLSGERTALLVWLLGMALSLCLCASTRRLMIVGGVLVALALASLSMVDSKLLTRQFIETRDQIVRFEDSTYGKAWGAAWEISRAHPLVGVGSKHFQQECRKPAYGLTDLDSLQLRCPLHTHNIYLEWLVEHGIIGFGLFMALLAAWLCDLRASRAIWLAQPLLLALVITLVMRLWPLSVTPSQFVSWSALPFWLVLGWLYAGLRKDKP